SVGNVATSSSVVNSMSDLTRRHLLYSSAAALAALGLAGCVSTSSNGQVASAVPPQPNGAPKPVDPAIAAENATLGPLSKARYEAIYGAVKTDRFPIPAVRLSIIKPPFRRQVVEYATKEAPGTIIVY